METFIGRLLTKNEIVHHINEIRNDNRLENLILTTRKMHNTIHFKNKNHTKEHNYKISIGLKRNKMEKDEKE